RADRVNPDRHLCLHLRSLCRVSDWTCVQTTCRRRWPRAEQVLLLLAAVLFLAAWIRCQGPVRLLPVRPCPSCQVPKMRKMERSPFHLQDRHRPNRLPQESEPVKTLPIEAMLVRFRVLLQVLQRFAVQMLQNCPTYPGQLLPLLVRPLAQV